MNNNVNLNASYTNNLDSAINGVETYSFRPESFKPGHVTSINKAKKITLPREKTPYAKPQVKKEDVLTKKMKELKAANSNLKKELESLKTANKLSNLDKAKKGIDADTVKVLNENSQLKVAIEKLKIENIFFKNNYMNLYTSCYGYFPNQLEQQFNPMQIPFEAQGEVVNFNLETAQKQDFPNSGVGTVCVDPDK